MSLPDEFLGEERHDPLGTAIELRRAAFGKRGDLGNLHLSSSFIDQPPGAGRTREKSGRSAVGEGRPGRRQTIGRPSADELVFASHDVKAGQG
jgi:hypothetical protein